MLHTQSDVEKKSNFFSHAILNIGMCFTMFTFPCLKKTLEIYLFLRRRILNILTISGMTHYVNHPSRS